MRWRPPATTRGSYAFRTWLLDCLWAGVPTVFTRGDDLAARVERNGIGAVAAPGCVAEPADAIQRALEAGRGAYAAPLAAVARDYEWAAVAAPLRRWVCAADGPPPPPVLRRHGHAVRSAGYRFARGGLSAVGLDWPSL